MLDSAPEYDRQVVSLSSLSMDSVDCVRIESVWWWLLEALDCWRRDEGFI